MLKNNGKLRQKQKKITKTDRRGRDLEEYSDDAEEFNVQDELDQ
jgi:hypothetical protein